MTGVALKGAAYALFHVPDLVRYGSKPLREIKAKPSQGDDIAGHLRSFEAAVAYAPNQVFIGNLAPEALWDIERPWWRNPLEMAPAEGPFGRIFDQSAFYEKLAEADVFGLVRLGGEPNEHSVSLYDGDRLIGAFDRGHEEDDNLTAQLLLENLACKATAAEPVRQLLRDFDPGDVDYVLNTGEEAIGDRYQRGGGSLSKAVAELTGCVNATGSDVKAFCCAPAHAIVIGASFIAAGVYRHVLIIGGGSLAKLGMKFQGHLRHDMPILEDTLASMAFLLGPDDGVNPIINLNSIGKHPVSAGSSPQAIYTALVAEPLERLGLRFADVDRYAVELHNPDVTEPQGSGDVPRINYRAIAALAAVRKEIQPTDIEAFTAQHGLPGFAPTQGHIPAAVPYLGHARQAMLAGSMQRAMFVSKGSLFLGKMTQLSDGMSFLLESADRSSRPVTTA